jgi:GAF domain-containing protein
MKKAEALLSTYLALFPDTTEEKILCLLLEIGAEIIEADSSALLVYDDEQRNLRFAMVIGEHGVEEELIGQQVPLGIGVTGLAASTGEVQMGTPTFLGVRLPERHDGDSNLPSAVLAAPMLVRDTLIGVITAASFAKGKQFSSKDARLYGGFATIAGLVVDQRRRLTAAASNSSAAMSQPKALGERGRTEQHLINSISRLLNHDPNTLKPLSQVLTAIEALVLPEGPGV